MRLSRSMPNVCQRNTVPESSFEAPPVICTFFEFGYQLGQIVASTICDQIFSQEAWMSSALCENRSALEGSKPGGQWMSFSRCVRSSCIVMAVLPFACWSLWPLLGVARANRIMTAVAHRSTRDGRLRLFLLFASGAAGAFVGGIFDLSCRNVWITTAASWRGGR